MSHTVDLGDTGMFHIHHPAAVNPHQWSLFVLIHSWKNCGKRCCLKNKLKNNEYKVLKINKNNNLQMEEVKMAKKQVVSISLQCCFLDDCVLY